MPRSHLDPHLPSRVQWKGINNLITPRSSTNSTDVITTDSGSYTSHTHIAVEFNRFFFKNVAQENTMDLIPPYGPIKFKQDRSTAITSHLTIHPTDHIEVEQTIKSLKNTALAMIRSIQT